MTTLRRRKRKAHNLLWKKAQRIRYFMIIFHFFFSFLFICCPFPNCLLSHALSKNHIPQFHRGMFGQLATHMEVWNPKWCPKNSKEKTQGTWETPNLHFWLSLSNLVMPTIIAYFILVFEFKKSLLGWKYLHISTHARYSS